MYSPRLRASDILKWAERYPVDYVREVNAVAIGKQMLTNRYLSKPELIEVTHWKLERFWTKKIQRSLDDNSPDMVEETTRAAFATTSEELRLRVLTLLYAVGWSVASAILHLGHKEDYPIIDIYA